MATEAQAESATKTTAGTPRGVQSDTHSIFVSGISSFWGRRIAKLLDSDPSCRTLIGTGESRLLRRFRKLEALLADVRDPAFIAYLKKARVDTAYHLDFVPLIGHSERVLDKNILGTMFLFSALARAGVRKIIFKSSISVYGAYFRNPHYIEESHPLRGQFRYQYNRDLKALESFMRKFAREHPRIHVTVLRYAHILGPSVNTPMSRYLELPRIPYLFGFEPLIQLVHEEDVLESMHCALTTDVDGPVNVAADGVLPLMKILRLTKKPTAPIFQPYAKLSEAVLGSVPGMPVLPIELEYLQYHCCGDNRRMKEALGFTPRYTPDETLGDFLRFRGHLDRHYTFDGA